MFDGEKIHRDSETIYQVKSPFEWCLQRLDLVDKAAEKMTLGFSRANT